MPNARCYRCNGIAYVTRALLPGNPSIDLKNVAEEVRLCTTCRSRADRENKAARERGVPT
jgi:hypothetical protein